MAPAVWPRARDDRVEIAVADAGKSRWSVAIPVYVIYPGRYHMGGASAFAMYDPDRHARAAAAPVPAS